MIDQSFLDNIELIVNNYDKCPLFCSSLFYSWQQPVFKKVDIMKIDTMKIDTMNITDDWKVVMMIATHLFRAFENIHALSRSNQTRLRTWIAIFLPWCKSKYLKKCWILLYPNYELKTIIFGNYIFNTVANMPEPRNAIEYYEMSLKIAQSEELDMILYNT